MSADAGLARRGLGGVPVNQTDMAATLVGALIAPPVGGLGMGILNAPEDLEAIAHLTRYVGVAHRCRGRMVAEQFP